MGLPEYQQAIALMSEHAALQDFVGARPESLVQTAEQALGLRFPPSYRRFLFEYGAGSFGSAEVYGVIDANFLSSSVPSGVWHTLSERRGSDLPSSMVVIYNDGAGDLFCLDCADQDGSEAPVVTFQPGVPLEIQRRKVLAPDFGRLSRSTTLVACPPDTEGSWRCSSPRPARASAAAAEFAANSRQGSSQNPVVSK